MAQQHQVKNIDGILKEYDVLLMEANRKSIMLSVALGEVQEENDFLKGEIEKLKSEKSAPDEKVDNLSGKSNK